MTNFRPSYILQCLQSMTWFLSEVGLHSLSACSPSRACNVLTFFCNTCTSSCVLVASRTEKLFFVHPWSGQTDAE